MLSGAWCSLRDCFVLFYLMKHRPTSRVSGRVSDRKAGEMKEHRRTPILASGNAPRWPDPGFGHNVHNNPVRHGLVEQATDWSGPAPDSNAGVGPVPMAMGPLPRLDG